MYSDRIDAIDILKGLAISMVLIVHSANLFQFSEPINYFLSYGQMGVQLFFLLSAFTLCISWNKHKEEEKPLKSYFINRLKRIAPSYWLMIVFYALLAFITIDVLHISCPFPIDRNLWDVLANVFFLHGLVPSAINLVVISGWYIGTAVILYALFPALYALYKKYCSKHKKTSCLITILVFLLVLGIRYMLESYNHNAYYSGNNSYLYYSFLNQLPVFCLGIELYFDYQHKKLKRPIAFGLFLVGTAISLYLFQYNTAIVFTIIPFITGISFYGLFQGVNSISFSPGNKTLKVFRSLGNHSYALYLVQPLTIFWMEYELVNRLPNLIHSFWFFMILLIPVFLATYYLGKLLEKVTALCFQWCKIK